MDFLGPERKEEAARIANIIFNTPGLKITFYNKQDFIDYAFLIKQCKNREIIVEANNGNFVASIEPADTYDDKAINKLWDKIKALPLNQIRGSYTEQGIKRVVPKQTMVTSANTNREVLKPENKAEKVLSWEKFEDYVVANKDNINKVSFPADVVNHEMVASTAFVHTKSGKIIEIGFSSPVKCEVWYVQRFFKDLGIFQQIRLPFGD